jgi:hypothetical protein
MVGTVRLQQLNDLRPEDRFGAQSGLHKILLNVGLPSLDRHCSQRKAAGLDHSLDVIEHRVPFGGTVPEHLSTSGICSTAVACGGAVRITALRRPMSSRRFSPTWMRKRLSAKPKGGRRAGRRPRGAVRLIRINR